MGSGLSAENTRPLQERLSVSPSRRGASARNRHSPPRFGDDHLPASRHLRDDPRQMRLRLMDVDDTRHESAPRESVSGPACPDTDEVSFDLIRAPSQPYRRATLPGFGGWHLFGSPRYSCLMATDTPPPDALVPRDRWQLFETLAGARVRSSDASWAGALSPRERLAVADDLFATVRAVRLAVGDWQQIDDRAWEATLAARIHDVAAFRRLDEVNRGSSPLANPG